MLIHMAEASCPELDERECVISASQEAIFEQLLGALPSHISNLKSAPLAFPMWVCVGGLSRRSAD
jgi:hypothetical protein